MATLETPLALRRIIGGLPGLAFCGLFFLFASVLVGLGAFNWHNAALSEAWPSTSGEIIHSEVEEHITVHRDKEGNVERTTVTHESKVVYQYRVGGTLHRAERVRFSMELNRAETETTVARYRKGSYVTVYYDPNDPSNAVLEPGGAAFVYKVMVGFGLCLGAIPMAFLLIRGLVLSVFPGWKIEFDRHAASRVAEAKGWRAKWAASNWMQRTILVFSIPLLAALLIAWLVWSTVILYRGVDGYLHPQGAQSWPATTGQVAAAEMSPVLVKKSDDEGRGGTFYRYDIDIAIEYRVLASRYTLAEQLSVAENEEEARATLARYPKGWNVTVYYNPREPSQAQLNPHAPFGLAEAALGSVMLLPWLAGGLMLVWLWVRKR